MDYNGRNILIISVTLNSFFQDTPSTEQLLWFKISKTECFRHG